MVMQSVDESDRRRHPVLYAQIVQTGEIDVAIGGVEHIGWIDPVIHVNAATAAEEMVDVRHPEAIVRQNLFAAGDAYLFGGCARAPQANPPAIGAVALLCPGIEVELGGQFYTAAMASSMVGFQHVRRSPGSPALPRDEAAHAPPR